MVRRKIIWTEITKNDLKVTILYLKKRSPQAAKKVKETLLKTVKGLVKHPEMYSSYPYVSEERGSIRSFTKWSYRVVYQVTDEEIIILRIEHTSQVQTELEEG